MSSFGRSRDFLVYLAVLIPYQAIRLMPYPVVKGMARLCGGTMNLIPSIRNLVRPTSGPPSRNIPKRRLHGSAAARSTTSR